MEQPRNSLLGQVASPARRDVIDRAAAWELVGGDHREKKQRVSAPMLPRDVCFPLVS